MALGAGMMFANFLMRNNAFNKYTVCLTLGLTILLSTTGLSNSTFVRLFNALFSDLTRFLKVQQYFVKYKLVIQLGFGSSLILSILGSFVRNVSNLSFSDSFNYIFGALIMIIGIMLFFTIGRKSSSIKASGTPND